MSGPVIAVRDLRKRFGAVVAADGISVSLAPGETVGIIGANGAGKTTFVNMVTGYLKPDAGSIIFRDQDITALTPREVTRLGIRRSFQVAQLFPNLTVLDNALAAIASAESRSLPLFSPLRTAARIEAARTFLRGLGLEPRAGALTTELPQGQRKLLDIGLAMAGRSDVLLLDEPTSGISTEEKFPMMDLIMRAAGRNGATILFVEHDMEIVERYARRVLAFYDGRIIADGAPGLVLADADVRRHVVGAELHRRGNGRAR